jgi:TAT (twin-arginine translocation) pathway signal sequence
MNSSPDEKQIGKDNFNEAVGTTRRDFLKGTVLAGAAAGVSMGSMYFGNPRPLAHRMRHAGWESTGFHLIFK